MKIRVVSDLHLEFFKDKFRWAIDQIDSTGADVLVVAGDLCTIPMHEEVLTYLSDKFPQVVLVLGNHDYYRATLRGVHKDLVEVCTRLKNIQWLHNSSVKIGEYRFVGTPLWFKDDPMNPIYARFLNDFSQIHKFSDWVYEENRKAVNYLNRSVYPGDIVVTHHAPTMKSVPERFLREPLNRFFVCDVEDMIRGLGPAMWIHGHTHDSFDYMIDETRIICNPMGYKHDMNPGFNPEFTIEFP